MKSPLSMSNPFSTNMGHELDFCDLQHGQQRQLEENSLHQELITFTTTERTTVSKEKHICLLFNKVIHLPVSGS